MEYQELDNLIGQLASSVEATDPQKGYWKELWALAGKIGAGFKGMRYPTREAKDAAWQRFQALCDKAKARSEQNRQRVEQGNREWDDRKRRSEQARGRVESRAAGSRPLSSLERGIADIILFPLTMAERLLEAVLGIRSKTELEQIRDELLSCNERLRSAWQVFGQNKDDLLPGDKAQAFQTLRSAQEKLNDAWTRWKEAKNRYHAANQEAWEAKQRNWEQKRNEFAERVQANIEKLEGKLDSARGALERQESHLSKLRDDYSSAWNDGFRDRCSGWIDEAVDKIADIRAHIDRLEGWLSEERGKL